jgi:hypothetical protein
MQPESRGDKAGINGPSRDGVVRFTDSKGRWWLVFERQRLCYDRRSISVLIFESDVAVRCVREYPHGWGHLEAEALESLSWRT